jgi:hypothetical protein
MTAGAGASLTKGVDSSDIAVAAQSAGAAVMLPRSLAPWHLFFPGCWVGTPIGIAEFWSSHRKKKVLQPEAQKDKYHRILVRMFLPA